MKRQRPGVCSLEDAAAGVAAFTVLPDREWYLERDLESVAAGPAVECGPERSRSAGETTGAARGG